eukprot:SAG11_NODE_4027_length_2099_cov_1.368000_1_plen_554_part_00
MPCRCDEGGHRDGMTLLWIRPLGRAASARVVSALVRRMSSINASMSMMPPPPTAWPPTTVRGSTGSSWTTAEARLANGWPAVSEPTGAIVLAPAGAQLAAVEATVTAAPRRLANGNGEQAGLYLYESARSWVKLVVEGASAGGEQRSGVPFLRGKLLLPAAAAGISVSLRIAIPEPPPQGASSGDGSDDRQVVAYWRKASARAATGGQWEPVCRGCGWLEPSERLNGQPSSLTDGDPRGRDAARCSLPRRRWRAVLLTEQWDSGGADDRTGNGNDRRLQVRFSDVVVEPKARQRRTLSTDVVVDLDPAATASRVDAAESGSGLGSGDQVPLPQVKRRKTAAGERRTPGREAPTETATVKTSLFLALEIPAQVQDAIHYRVNAWAAKQRAIYGRVGDFQYGVLMHATVVSPELSTVAEWGRALEPLSAAHAPITARLRGFSKREATEQRPGTLRVMIEPNAALDALCTDCKRLLDKQDGRGFSGHITPARLEDPKPVTTGWIASFGAELGKTSLSEISWTVNTVCVISSDQQRLKSDPPEPKYRVESTVPLGKL